MEQYRISYLKPSEGVRLADVGKGASVTALAFLGQETVQEVVDVEQQVKTQQ